jgi:hypothetical protein
MHNAHIYTCIYGELSEATSLSINFTLSFVGPLYLVQLFLRVMFVCYRGQLSVKLLISDACFFYTFLAKILDRTGWTIDDGLVFPIKIVTNNGKPQQQPKESKCFQFCEKFDCFYLIFLIEK